MCGSRARKKLRGVPLPLSNERTRMGGGGERGTAKASEREREIRESLEKLPFLTSPLPPLPPFPLVCFTFLLRPLPLPFTQKPPSTKRELCHTCALFQHFSAEKRKREKKKKSEKEVFFFFFFLKFKFFQFFRVLRITSLSHQSSSCIAAAAHACTCAEAACGSPAGREAPQSGQEARRRCCCCCCC